jgi:hypothetical protein
VIIGSRRQSGRRIPLPLDRGHGSRSQAPRLPRGRLAPGHSGGLELRASQPRIEHFRRAPDGWRIQDLRGHGSLHLEALNVAIDLPELYAGVLPSKEAQAKCPWGVTYRHAKKPAL